MKLAGTMCDVVTRSPWMSSRHDSAVKRGITTTAPPSPRLICAYAPGAVWYAGPHKQVHVERLEAPERGERVRRVLGGGQRRRALDALRATRSCPTCSSW